MPAPLPLVCPIVVSRYVLHVDIDELVAAALGALARFDLDRPVRLVGVKADLE